jgi:hypothetical protein
MKPHRCFPDETAHAFCKPFKEALALPAAVAGFP